MSSVYDKKYYLRHLSYSGSDSERHLNEFRCSLVRKALNSLLHSSFKESHTVVDYGCSHGAFLEVLEKYELPNFNFIGVDINPYCVSHCVSRGLKAFTPAMYEEFYGELSVTPDIVTFWDVFEHLQNPSAILKNLNPDIICLSLPCLDGWLESSPNKDIQLWHHYRPLEHLFNWKHDDLIEYLDKHGYKVTYSTFDESKIRVNSSIGEKNIMSFIAVRKG